MACLANMNKADLLLEAKKLQKMLEEERNQKLVHEETILKTQVQLQESRLQKQKLQHHQEAITRLQNDIEFFRKQTEKQMTT